MAKRGRLRKSQPITVELDPGPAVNPVIFQALDTSWVDQVEPDESDESDLERDPGPEPELPLVTVTVRPVEDADIDRLWDWIRADADRGQVFLGFVPATARELYGMFANRFSGQPDTAAWAIDEHGAHQGFVLFNPITTQLTATVHLYLSQAARGRFLEIVQQLLDFMDATYPKLSLVIVTPDAARARLYQKAGFDMSYQLRRASKG